jgi:asparagine synthase (glutamine-hydrolysing)
MCGITGILDSQRATGADTLTGCVRSMSDAIRHRGPDGAGAWVDADAGVALGHRRLAILDLSAEGHQPMASVDGRYVIAFNGEIYNFAALREQEDRATAAPPRWRGHSDTEILLALIARVGVEQALTRCNGMFAIAIWDRAERELWLARDRAGEKPLYYGWCGSQFLFGSELKALRAHPAWHASLDHRALALFLRHGYVPAPYSAYQGIAKLAPASFLRVPAGARPGDLLTQNSYWSPADVVARGLHAPHTGGDAAVLEQLDALLRDAVALRMVADVPLGAFLSGGIDSSLIAGMMQAQSTRPVRTFSIGFHEAAFNEAEHAREVAAHLGTAHTEFYVTAEEARNVIPLLPGMYDEPFADSSQIPTHLVCALARQHVTVALTGDGGDELFGGYQRYFIGRDMWRRLAPVPRSLRRGLATGITALSPDRWNMVARTLGPVLPRRLRRPDVGAMAHKVARVLGASDASAFYLGLVSQEDAPHALIGAAEHPTWLSGLHALPELPTLTDRMMFLDFVTYLPDDILVKVDRAAMAVALEGRIPLLDHRVIEFAWQLPMAMKVRDGQGKWALRQLLDRYVPRILVDRPKTGFGVPIDQWLRGPLRSWADDLLSPDRLRAQGLLDVAWVRRVWAGHLSGAVPAHYWLWNILMLQSWLDAEAALTSIPDR